MLSASLKVMMVAEIFKIMPSQTARGREHKSRLGSPSTSQRPFAEFAVLFSGSSPTLRAATRVGTGQAQIAELALSSELCSLVIRDRRMKVVGIDRQNPVETDP